MAGASISVAVLPYLAEHSLKPKKYSDKAKKSRLIGRSHRTSISKQHRWHFHFVQYRRSGWLLHIAKSRCRAERGQSACLSVDQMSCHLLDTCPVLRPRSQCFRQLNHLLAGGVVHDARQKGPGMGHSKSTTYSFRYLALDFGNTRRPPSFPAAPGFRRDAPIAQDSPWQLASKCCAFKKWSCASSTAPSAWRRSTMASRLLLLLMDSASCFCKASVYQCLDRDKSSTPLDMK